MEVIEEVLENVSSLSNPAENIKSALSTKLMALSFINISELSRISGVSKPNISKYFKAHPQLSVQRNNNRIVGVTPDSAEQFLIDHMITHFKKGAVVLVGNCCGGVGKTSASLNLACAARRVVALDSPIVLADGDPQGSFTSMVFGKPANDSESILIDFLSGKATINDILTPIGNNMWFVKSNLNQIYLDKLIDKPKEIKSAMSHFYQEIFRKLGPKTKIFQDHTPQLSSLLASSICGIHQLPTDIIKAIVIPMRSDVTAIRGADYVLLEIEELSETFSFSSNIDVHCVLSGLDNRVKSITRDGLKIIADHQNIVNNLSNVVIRYSSELSRCINNSQENESSNKRGHINVFSRGKMNNAGEDYQDLLDSIFDKSSFATSSNLGGQ